MKNNKVTKLLAYILVPVVFSLIGYFLLAVALKPVVELVSQTSSVLMASEAPRFNKELKVIYDPEMSAPVQTEEVTKIEEETQEEVVVEEPYIDIKDIDFPTDGTQYGHISCERIGLDAPVYWDDTNEILRVGVGQYIASNLPGFGESIVLSAHNTSFFLCLQYIEEGDEIIFDTNYCTYKYKVTKTEVKKEWDLANDIGKLIRGDEEILLMYTCWPFDMYLGRKTDRFIVYAERTEGLNVRWRASQW